MSSMVQENLLQPLGGDQQLLVWIFPLRSWVPNSTLSNSAHYCLGSSSDQCCRMLPSALSSIPLDNCHLLLRLFLLDSMWGWVVHHSEAFPLCRHTGSHKMLCTTRIVDFPFSCWSRNSWGPVRPWRRQCRGLLATAINLLNILGKAINDTQLLGLVQQE